MDATHLKLLFNGADDSKNIRKIWYIDEFIIIMIYTKSKPENFSVQETEQQKQKTNNFKNETKVNEPPKETSQKLYSANNILVDMNFVKSEAETAIDTNLAINFYIMEFPLISLLKFLKDKLILKDYLLHIV